MTVGSAGRLRDPRGPQQAGFAELLFDVVFVFAFTRLSGLLAEDLSWRGAYEALLLYLAMWWVWYRLAWTTNRYDPTQPAIQLSVIVTMLASLLLAAALPEAHTERGLVFATVYVAIQALRSLWLVLLNRDRTAQLVSARILFWVALSAGPWVIGALHQDTHRLLWWSLAVGLDYLGAVLDFPTPGLGRARLRSQAIAEKHLTERYRQVLIIAFGETILISGIEFSPYGFERDRTLALLVSFTITVLLWQIYFYRAGELLPVAIASAAAPARVSELASYSHVIMIAGINLSAVGDKLIITHPFEHTDPAWVLVIFGGPAVFLLGRALLDYATFSRVSWSRPSGLLALAALAAAALHLPPIAATGLAAAVLAGIATANILSWRLSPRIPTPPRLPGP